MMQQISTLLRPRKNQKLHPLTLLIILPSLLKIWTFRDNF